MGSPFLLDNDRMGIEVMPKEAINVKCPRPELYQIHRRPEAEIEVTEVIYGLVRAIKPELVLETGAAWGQTTEVIGRALKRNNFGSCVSVEMGENRALAAKKRVRGLPVKIIHGKWQDFVPNRSIEFAFFDGSKERDEEFLYFKKWIPVGSFVAFHDTCEGRYLSKRLPELEEAGVLKLLRVETPRGLTIGVVQ